MNPLLFDEFGAPLYAPASNSADFLTRLGSGLGGLLGVGSAQAQTPPPDGQRPPMRLPQMMMPQPVTMPPGQAGLMAGVGGIASRVPTAPVTTPASTPEATPPRRGGAQSPVAGKPGTEPNQPPPPSRIPLPPQRFAPPPEQPEMPEEVLYPAALPVVTRSARRPQPAPPAPASQPGLTTVPAGFMGATMPDQPSELAMQTLGGGGQPQPQGGGVGGIFARLSPDQRMAAALHAIKGDYGEIAKMLSDTPAARADRAAADERGKATGQAQANLPQAVQSGVSMLNNIDAVLGDANLGNITGWQQWGPLGYLPYSSGGRDTLGRVSQIQGQAFLQAFQSLRGGGQITEQEGAKAQAALTRLGDMAQSDEGYIQALNDARREIWDLVNLARTRAGLEPVPYRGPDRQSRPAINAVEDGYRYKGGDPANRSSWEAVR